MDVMDMIMAKKLSGSGGGGADILNENGIIKQQHLPENFPYKEGSKGEVFTQEMINNATEYFGTLKKVSDIAYTKEQLWGSTFVITLPDVGEQILVCDNDMYFEEIETPPSLLVSDGAITVVKEDFEVDGAVITRGLWITDASSEGGSTELRLPSHETVTKIGKEYLPEGYPYAEGEVKTFINNPELMFVEEVGGFASTNPIAETPVVGLEYTVNWNGTEYTTVCQAYEEEGVMLGWGFGNLGTMTGQGATGEPFVIVVPTETGFEMLSFGLLIVPLDGSVSVSVSVSGFCGTIQKIDKMYLPEDKSVIYFNLVGLISSHGFPGKQSHSNQEIVSAVKAGKYVVLTDKPADSSSLTSVYTLYGTDASDSPSFVRHEKRGEILTETIINVNADGTFEILNY